MRKDLILVRVMGTNSQNAWSSKGNSWQNSSWNSGGDNTGKGGKSHKGGKSKDSGKGKDVTCHRCGGHGLVLEIAESEWLDSATMVQL